MREKIAEKLATEVRARLGAKYSVMYKEVTKNNSVKYPVVDIARLGEQVSQLFYIDWMLDRVEGGDIDIQDAAREVITTYLDYEDERIPEFAKHLDKDMILQKAVFQMINREKNLERLHDMPHRDLLDLSVVYLVVDDDGDDVWHSIAVTRPLCKRYGIDDEELFCSARKNVAEIGFQTKTVADILAEDTGVSVEVPDTVPPLSVLSTNTQRYGASVMLFNDEFDKLAERYGSDLYVLPSSIHEVLAVPTGGLEPWELRCMVSYVNDSEVLEEDQLSDNLYRYSRKDGCLTIA